MEALYAILGIAAIFGAIKAIDWAIAIKYKTQKDCASCQSACRKEIFGHINGNRDLLVKLNTNMELLMNNFELKQKEK